MDNNRMAGSVSATVDQYRVLAGLASDWLWELDEKLHFVFHDGVNPSLSGYSNKDLVGKCRISLMNSTFPESAALKEHNHCLITQKRMDLVLPTGLDTVKHVHIIAEPQFTESGVFTGFFGCARDVSTRVEMEEQLNKLATLDDLTGAMNRREFEKQLNCLHGEAQQGANHFALCVLDLDRFKLVNDTGGHQAGDQLLRDLVNIMSRYVQPGETVGRLGGDEFGLLLRSEVSMAKKLMEQLIKEISRYQFEWDGNLFNVGASIGLSAISQGCAQPQELMVSADLACYDAKNNGRNQAVVSAPSKSCAPQIMQASKPVEEALLNNRFKLLAQQIASTGRPEPINRYEILLRLECADGSFIEPDAFMPIAKRFSLMQELDHWVVENSLAALTYMHANGEDAAISINLSVHTLVDQDALNKIKQLFAVNSIPDKRVCIDIAEAPAMRNFNGLTEFMYAAQLLGVEFALDDFGNDISSVTYLRNLPIDYLKIDGALIRHINTDKTAYSMVRAFNDLSHTLGIKTIAESVEDDATVRSVSAMGIDYMQGFGVSELCTLSSLAPKPLEHATPLKLHF